MSEFYHEAVTVVFLYSTVLRLVSELYVTQVLFFLLNVIFIG